MMHIRYFTGSPWHIILVSFITIIGLGTLLLSLPIAQAVPLAFLDVLFTAASATCVTGLSTVPIESFTFFGHCILLALIQIGGLGLVTLSFFVASLFLNFGLATRLIAGEILDFQFWGRIKQFLMLIIGVTVVSELIGTLILYQQFASFDLPHGRFFNALFHSVSAFCNAGISLFPDNMVVMQHNPITLLTLCVLMLAGGIGFIVWYDLARIVWSFIQSLIGKASHVRITLHSKIALSATAALTFMGCVIFWQLERFNVLMGESVFLQTVNALFCVTSARGAGFTTVMTTSLNPAVLFTFLLLMFIGASPGSTGSGIKTTTFIIFSATILTIVRSRSSVEIAGRRISHDQVFKVMAIVALAAFWLFCTTFSLLLTEHALLTEHGWQFLDIAFEAVSAFGTCGLSTGITASLSSIGKCIIIATMFVGRVGSITLALALRHKPENVLYQYPEERIMIG